MCHIWKVLEDIMLSEISQLEEDILYDLTCMWNSKKFWTHGKK